MTITNIPFVVWETATTGFVRWRLCFDSVEMMFFIMNRHSQQNWICEVN